MSQTAVTTDTLRAAAGNDATRRLARHAATLRYEALPPALVELTKQCVLDTLGVTIGASSLSPEAKIVADYVHDLGGKAESTILGFGGKAPAPWAVFVNGSLGHMLEYDDLGGGHVSIVTVPVAFALAEKCGGMSGRDLITAIAAGADVMTRLTLTIRIPDWTMTEGWFATQLLGFVGGAATAARALGLDEEGTENALGIGFNQMSGSRQMAVGGGLGTRFPLLDTHGFKVWPACGYTRPVNAAVLQLREELGLRPDDVESITVIGGTRATQLLSEPLERKRRPQVSIDGKYSIPFTTAVMMAKGGVTLLDYTDRGLRDPAVRGKDNSSSFRRSKAWQGVQRKFRSSAPGTAARCMGRKMAFRSSATRSWCGPCCRRSTCASPIASASTPRAEPSASGRRTAASRPRWRRFLRIVVSTP